MGEETDKGKLFRLKGGSGGIITQELNGKITWGNPSTDAGIRCGRGRNYHICGVIPQDYEVSGVPSAGMYGNCPHFSLDTGNFMYSHFILKLAVMHEGREPLPGCNMCGIHMSEGQLIKYRRLDLRIRICS